MQPSTPNWRPQSFGYELFGCRVSLDFPAVKLLDYTERWATLEANPNPFAVVVMAHLQTQQTRQQPAERYAAKLKLAQMLYRRGYNRQDVLELFRFIDWLLTLPDDLEQQFRVELEQIEAEVKMEYVTSIERLAMEEGRQEGMREMLIDLLQARFGTLTSDLTQKLERVETNDRLKALFREALTVASLSAFELLLSEDETS